jgi:hypothetical protein
VRERTLDGDRVLTAKERKLVDESYENQKKGMLVPISDVKKELGI